MGEGGWGKEGGWGGEAGAEGGGRGWREEVGRAVEVGGGVEGGGGGGEMHHGHGSAGRWWVGLQGGKEVMRWGKEELLECGRSGCYTPPQHPSM